MIKYFLLFFIVILFSGIKFSFTNIKFPSIGLQNLFIELMSQLSIELEYVYKYLIFANKQIIVNFLWSQLHCPLDIDRILLPDLGQEGKLACRAHYQPSLSTKYPHNVALLDWKEKYLLLPPDYLA